MNRRRGYGYRLGRAACGKRKVVRLLARRGCPTTVSFLRARWSASAFPRPQPPEPAPGGFGSRLPRRGQARETQAPRRAGRGASSQAIASFLLLRIPSELLPLRLVGLSCVQVTLITSSPAWRWSFSVEYYTLSSRYGTPSILLSN